MMEITSQNYSFHGKGFQHFDDGDFKIFINAEGQPEACQKKGKNGKNTNEKLVTLWMVILLYITTAYCTRDMTFTFLI